MRIRTITGLFVFCSMPWLVTPASAYPGGEVASGRVSPDVGVYQPNNVRSRPGKRVRHAVRYRAAVRTHRPRRAVRVASTARPAVTRSTARPAVIRSTARPAVSHRSGRKMASVIPARGRGGSSLLAEARRHLGTNPTGRASLWCGHFMNMILKRTGRPASASNTARSFASYGRRISGPRIGAIVVMSRGKRGGHVGVVSGVDRRGNPVIVSGNHGRRVAEAVYPRRRVLAYVMP
jgi:uncharacterized protein (TIGR02594 family)